MEVILSLLSKVLAVAAGVAVNSTSLVIAYQPEKPKCLEQSDD